MICFEFSYCLCCFFVSRLCVWPSRRAYTAPVISMIYQVSIMFQRLHNVSYMVHAAHHTPTHLVQLYRIVLRLRWLLIDDLYVLSPIVYALRLQHLEEVHSQFAIDTIGGTPSWPSIRQWRSLWWLSVLVQGSRRRGRHRSTGIPYSHLYYYDCCCYCCMLFASTFGTVNAMAISVTTCRCYYC